MPSAIWHGIRLRWLIPAATADHSLADLATDDTLAALLSELASAHSVEWDGNKHVGKYPECISDAIAQHLERVLDTALVYQGIDALREYERDHLARMVERDGVDGALAIINTHDAQEVALVEPVTADHLADELADHDIAAEYPGAIRALVAYGVMSKSWLD